MPRRSLKPQLNQIRAWVHQGRTDAWIAHQLEVSATELRALFFHGVKWINSRVRTPETWRRAIALVASGTIDLMPMVTHRYELARGIDAFELLRERKGVKALILPHG